MSPTRYQTVPTTVEALQYDGNNAVDVVRWVETSEKRFAPVSLSRTALVIGTRDHAIVLQPGDWVVRDDNGTHHAVGAFEFIKRYRLASTG